MSRAQLNDLLDEYKARFGETFPSEELHIYTDAEFVEKLSNCIKQGKSAEELYDLAAARKEGKVF